MRTAAPKLATAIGLATGRDVFIRDRKVQSNGWFKRQRCAHSTAWHFGRRTIYLYDADYRKPVYRASRMLAKLQRECSGSVRRRFGGRVA